MLKPNQVQRTLYTTFTEENIKIHAQSAELIYLRDRGCKRLMFRYLDDRTAGTWSVYGNGVWARLGSWPEMSCIDATGIVMAGLAIPAVSSRAALVTIGDVLRNYADRQQHNRSISAAHRSTVRTAIFKHLIPRLGRVTIERLDKAMLVRLLIGPMREHSYAVSYVHQVFNVLKNGCAWVASTGRARANPLKAVFFHDFGLPRARPRVSRLRPVQLPAVVNKVESIYGKNPMVGTLLMLMLAHGTRIGETRQAKWADFDLEAGVWLIPAKMTKTRVALELPLTDFVIDWLKRYRETFARASVYLFPVNRHVMCDATARWHIQRVSGGDWSAHDLRKLARGNWALLGVDWSVCESLLNHTPPVLDQTYSQVVTLSRKREALSRWHRCLSGHDYAYLAGHYKHEPVSHSEVFMGQNDGLAIFGEKAVNGSPVFKIEGGSIQAE